MEYVYRPLTEQSKEIRLLVLLPGHPQDIIRVELKHIACPFLGSIGQSNGQESKRVTVPEYEALSYVWGTRAGQQKILVVEQSWPSQKFILVTKNLHAALRYLRSESEGRILWVDAVCINQKDLAERGNQVLLMRFIYSNASRVLAWLGVDADGSDTALDMVAELGRSVEKVDWHETSISTHGLPQHTARQWKSLMYLLRRQWFRRLWIRQEIYHARTAIVICGHKAVPWPQFENGLYRLGTSNLEDTNLDDVGHQQLVFSLSIAFLLCKHLFKRHTYESLRHFLRGIEWTDPRDTLYAVTHLLHADDYRLGVEPDYTITTTEAFIKTARRKIECQRSLELLGTCEMQAGGTRGLPSWVPDWANRLKANRSFIQHWSSCAWISAEVNCTIEPNGSASLRAAGRRIATVDDVQVIDFEDNVLDHTKIVERLQRLRPNGSMEASYKAGGHILDAYCQIIRSCSQKKSGEHDETARQALRDIWLLEELGDADLTDSRLDVIRCFFISLIGRAYFTTVNDYIGIGYMGVKSGDIVVVFLGCSTPIILREVATSSMGEKKRWQVVGNCFIPGFMMGEAIHGPISSRYRAIDPASDQYELINGYSYALQDKTNGLVHTDPSQVLNMMGIQHTRYRRDPHILDVSKEELDKAGIGLSEFTIV